MLEKLCLSPRVWEETETLASKGNGCSWRQSWFLKYTRKSLPPQRSSFYNLPMLPLQNWTEVCFIWQKILQRSLLSLQRMWHFFSNLLGSSWVRGMGSTHCFQAFCKEPHRASSKIFTFCIVPPKLISETEKNVLFLASTPFPDLYLWVLS